MKPEKKPYGYEYDIVHIDEVRELRERRALDRITPAQTRTRRTPSQLVRVALTLLLGHVIALYFFIKKL